MYLKNLLSTVTLLIALLSCSSDDVADQNQAENPQSQESMYFPPLNSNDWETKSVSSLGWNQSKIPDLLNYLQTKNSKSFIILQNGRIVMENYFDSHTSSSVWYWASAGKTLTSTVIGIAEQEGFININHKVSNYIGNGWTSEPLTKENLITCKHLLTMTSGLDDALGDNVAPNNLQYKADAGTRWAYHNVYVKLQDVVSQATGKTWSEYFNTKLRDKIGMNGNWIQNGDNSVYWSNTRSMARFGLLALNNGNWNGSQIVNANYFNNATNTSQNINLSYGYLWWLNGKTSYHLPQSQLQFPGKLIPSAPDDMYCALGKNDQKIYVVPNKKLVIIRMGNAADNMNLALSDFDDVLWEKINAVIN
ncbi:serine hydrolase domain-containing protein [Chryseobacterium aquaticum]|uniref:serine hydrolase domain-containing protein n=1 Tax=Chryseobacterium aquaticum TaxID=452084 RepID=UPI003F72FFEF